MKYSTFLITLMIFSGAMAADKAPLSQQSFSIFESYFEPSQKKVMVQVNHGCGCGENVFKFKNFRKNQSTQEIDLELMSNNACKALCTTWQTLSIADFPEVSTNSDLIIHVAGTEERTHTVDFKQRKRNPHQSSPWKKLKK